MRDGMASKLLSARQPKPMLRVDLYGRRSDETCRPRLRLPKKVGKPVFHKSILTRRDHFKGLEDTKDIRYYNPRWLARGDYRVEK